MRVNKLWVNLLKGENIYFCKNEIFKKREKKQ